ncbi:MAG TPA: hypothetical protein VIL46_10840, partial [Gemmataceae bacterium]
MSVGELERTEQFRGEPAEAPARRSGWVGNTLGWLWRLGVGALLCTNYLTGVLVVGWLTRRARAGAVRVWWRAGPRPGRGETFEEFCDRQGPDGPSLRPRWLLHQRPDAVLHAPGSDGEKPSGGRVLLRLPRALAGSAAENAVAGVRVLFGTVLLMGWGVLLLQLAWEFGWLNSFTKGYERHFYGAQMGLIAHALFALAMIYVPMAQAHCAATGELRAFLDFRFLSALIRARMTGSVLLAACTLLAALPLMILTVAPQFFNQMNPRFEYATDEQVLQFMRRYVLAHALVLFVALVILRQWAARLYASAVLKVVRRGRVRPGELHPAV